MVERNQIDIFQLLMNGNRERSRVGEEDAFSNLMFGKRPQKLHEAEERQMTMSSIIDQVDAKELFDYVDQLVISAKELKPILGKVLPILDQFIKK